MVIASFLDHPWFIRFLSKLNNTIFLNSADSVSPFVDLSDRKSLSALVTNFDTIRQETLGALPFAKPIQGDLFFDENITDDGKWNRIYLKWYSKPSLLAKKLFPQTLAIIEPHKDIRLAMISILEPGAKIKPHCGPWSGSIRVHITLEAPDSPDCFIEVAGQRYSWHTGELIAFNDLYLHHVQNNTDKRRIVLFLDVERKMRNTFWQFVVRFFNSTVARATSRD
jgi:beta-hydroxylase